MKSDGLDKNAPTQNLFTDIADRFAGRRVGDASLTYYEKKQDSYNKKKYSSDSKKNYKKHRPKSTPAMGGGKYKIKPNEFRDFSTPKMGRVKKSTPRMGPVAAALGSAAGSELGARFAGSAGRLYGPRVGKVTSAIGRYAGGLMGGALGAAAPIP